jgi:hypothetical protein
MLYKIENERKSTQTDPADAPDGVSGTPTMPTGCTCPTCVAMCRCHPCAPTVNEARLLIKNGYAKRLMLKIWASRDDPHFAIVGLCPAIVGFECGVDPMKSYLAPCTFLKNDRCELHNLGLKPSEGKFATHDTTPAEEEINDKEIIKTWLTDEGDQLIHEWEELCEVKIQGPGFE